MKKFLSVMLAFLTVLSVVPAAVFADAADEPVEIGTLDALLAYAAAWNDEDATNNYSAVLTSDIVITAEDNWVPFGFSNATFDGQGHKITLTVDKAVGFMKYIVNAVVKNLDIDFTAKNINDEAAKELTHIMDLQDFYFSKHDAEHLRQEDEDFHDALCRHCKRAVIADTLMPLHRKTRRFRKISIENFERQSRSIEEHWAICRAVIAGEADLAASLTAEHVKKAKANMIERIKANG